MGSPWTQGRRFAVIDVETTGVFPHRHDRVVELAVVVTRGDGTVEDEFSTLVNPGRDVGPTSIHGISAADVVNAPTFGDVVGEVVARLRGAVVAGHNVRFDEAFLRAECERIGVELPPFPSLCTLALVSRLAIDVPTRRLGDCCRALGVAAADEHSALGDARAAAGLLAACIRLAGDGAVAALDDVGCDAPAAALDWPRSERTGRSLRRDAARRAAAEEVPFLARAVAALPADSALSGDAAGYLHALDRALADRIVTREEAESMVELARTFGLSRGDAEALHRRYFDALRRAALADHRISDLERADLEAVARLLGLGPDALDVTEGSAGGSGPATGVSAVPCAEGLAGKSVCFTGELGATIDGEPVSRAHAEALARAAGLVVARGVTKSLDLLVLADPHSMSGKAKKARQYGTRILAEPVFWRAIGVRVD